MKVGFFHDTKLVEYESQMYSTGVGYEVWRRYLQVFDKLVVCTRKDEGKLVQRGKYSLSSGKDVEFRLNQVYKSPIQLFTQYKKINKPVREVVQEVDACIVRLPSTMGILAIRECIRQGKPWLAEVVSCSWNELWYYGSIKGKMLAPIMWIITRYDIKRSSYVIYVTHKYFQKKYPTRGQWSGCSDVNIGKIDEDVLKRRLERIHNREINEPIYLGLIGSLDVAYKGHDTAIRAIKVLKSRGYDVRLRCLGKGKGENLVELARKLEVEDKIEFCGTVGVGEPVFEWLDNIDVFIMPSLTEGLPRSLVEAMSRACPAIGSNVGGIVELLNKEVLVQPRKYKILANIIEEFIKGREYMKREAIDNFEKSRQYVRSVLDSKRNEMFEDFVIAHDFKK